MLAAVATSIVVAACAAPSSTPSPSLATPVPTPSITERPTPPTGLALRGAEAPRNVPDPCALLDLDELTAILGATPTVAERSYTSDDDSWSCAVVVGDEPVGVSVQVYVNGAYPGWTTDIVDQGGATLLGHPTLVGVAFEGGGIGVELGQDIVVLLHVVDSATGPDAPLITAASAMVERRTGED